MRSMGMSDVRFYTTVLAAFSLILPLYWVFPFLEAFYEVPSIRSSSAIFLGLFFGLLLRILGNYSPWLGSLGPIVKWAGTTNSPTPQYHSSYVTKHNIITNIIMWFFIEYYDIISIDLCSLCHYLFTFFFKKILRGHWCTSEPWE